MPALPYASLCAGADVRSEFQQQFGYVIMALRARLMQRRVASVVGHRRYVLQFLDTITDHVLWSKTRKTSTLIKRLLGN